MKEKGEADSYEGLKIDFVHGRKAKLFLYDKVTGEEVEVIELHSIATIEEMHQLMIDKGFERNTNHVPLPEVHVENIMEKYDSETAEL